MTVTAADDSGAPVSFTVTAQDEEGSVSTAYSHAPGSTFSVGTTPVTVTAIDETDNSATCTFTVTVKPPPLAAPVITSPTPGATLDDLTPVFSGTARPGSAVTLTVDDVDVGTVTASEAGAWSFTATSPLAEGTHGVSATARHLGSTSPTSAVVSFTVDLPPEQPAPEEGGGCSAGPGDSSWLLASLALLAAAAARRRRLAR
jgi:MYXO-CTERM domain-containing protein